MRFLKLPKVKRIARLSFAPGGDQLAAITSAAEDHVGSVLWFAAADGAPRSRIDLDAEYCTLATDHRRVAAAWSSYTRPKGEAPARWANVPETGEPDWYDVPNVPHKDVTALAFTVDGQRLAIGCHGRKSMNSPWDSAILVTPFGLGKTVTIPSKTYAGELAFSSDGRWLAVTGGAGAEPGIQFFDAAAAKPAHAVYTPDSTRTRRLAFAPSGTMLVALAGKQVHFLTAGQSEPLTVASGHTAQVTDAAFTPDGRRVFTASHDGTVQVWDAATGTLVAAFSWSIGKLTAIAIAADGLTAAAAGEKGQVVIWDLDE